MTLPLMLNGLLWVFAATLGQPGPAGSAANAAPDNACVACHQDLPGRLSAVVYEWKQSVHYQNKITCDGCHGGDPAVKPLPSESAEALKNRSHLRRDTEFLILSQRNGGFTASARGRSVSYFCGKCHALIKEKHLGSPHGDLGNPSCLYCHGQGSHQIQESSVEIIDTRMKREGGRCATCHQAATMETVASIKNALLNAENQLKIAASQYTWLEAHDYKNLAMEKMDQHSQETISQLRQTFHSFNMREINNFTSAIKANAELTQQTYEMVATLDKTKVRQAWIGVGSVIFLLAFAGLLLVYRKTLHVGKD